MIVAEFDIFIAILVNEYYYITEQLNFGQVCDKL